MLSGIGIAKVAGLIALPFLTKFYSSAEFGILGVYIAIVLICKSFANGGFEVAILLPEEKKEANGIFSLCNRINNSVFLVLLVLVIFIFVFDPFDAINLIFGHLNILLLMPISIWLEGKAMSLKYLLNRNKVYDGISKAIIAQAFITVAAQFLFVLWLPPMKINGLVLGLVLGEFAMFFVMRFYADFSLIKSRAFQNSLAKKYWQFLQYGVSGNFVNSLANFAPYVLFHRHFGASMNGQFTMSNQKILSAPINLIAAAISPVYYESANRAAKEEGNKLSKITNELTWVLLFMILPAVVVLMIWGPQLFSLLFGEEWYIAGEYARYLAPFMGIRFIVHPLSYLIDIKFKLKQQLIFNGLYLIIILMIFGFIWSSFEHLALIKIYGLSSFVMYFLYYLYLLRLSKSS